MQETYNVGIYCRLSREDERTGESVSVENQREMLSRYVLEQGWNLYAAYCDDGVSGTTFDRPGFNQLIADATAGKINLVLCKDLSRLGRDYIESGKYTDIVFPSLGCRFIALNDGVDTAHKNNEMLVILKNVMNDLYARDTSAKIRAVKRSSFQAGKYVGCYAPIGYLKSPDDKHILIPDPATAPLVRRIFDMRCQGLSYRKIATTRGPVLALVVVPMMAHGRAAIHTVKQSGKQSGLPICLCPAPGVLLLDCPYQFPDLHRNQRLMRTLDTNPLGLRLAHLLVNLVGDIAGFVLHRMTDIDLIAKDGLHGLGLPVASVLPGIARPCAIMGTTTSARTGPRSGPPMKVTCAIGTAAVEKTFVRPTR